MKWIRPTIISMLAIGVTIGFFTGKIQSGVFVPFATGLIVYWFKERDSTKENKP